MAFCFIKNNTQMDSTPLSESISAIADQSQRAEGEDHLCCSFGHSPGIIHFLCDKQTYETEREAKQRQGHRTEGEECFVQQFRA